MCLQCNGTKDIVRPKWTKNVIIERPYQVRNRVEYYKEEETITFGGVDACPICSAKAETEYQAKRT